ncbi:MAG TPA: O-methyltransferase [Terriglobales bacterium]|nr:O-methyltransferase [Terriglobales bacterium]
MSKPAPKPPQRAYWMVSSITSEPVEQYIYEILPQRDEALAEMEDEAARRKIPIVGPAVGRLFYLLARTSGARTVFEMGSAIGYSTIWWARGVGREGRVIYTDGDSRNAEEARRNFQRAGVAEHIELRVGDALEILSEHKPESLDIIFNDVDKQDYPRVFRLAVPRLKPGGLFVTDNVLWSGRVTEKNPAEASTRAILEFNSLLYGARELFPVIIPLRDGVAVAVKEPR